MITESVQIELLLRTITGLDLYAVGELQVTQQASIALTGGVFLWLIYPVIPVKLVFFLVLFLHLLLLFFQVVGSQGLQFKGLAVLDTDVFRSR